MSAPFDVALAEARRRYPEIRISEADVAAHLGEQPLPEHFNDLYLACGCCLGDAAALAAFERDFMSQVPVLVSRMREPAAFVEDLGQLLREHLLVGKRKLREYSGRGSLTSWLRVLATRTAIDMRRKRSEILRDANDILDEAAETAGSDPELAFIRKRCRQHFVDALETAVATLSDDERTLLRLHFLEGVTLDALAPMLNIHRTTVARRIAAMRRQLIKMGRQVLRERLALTPSELSSMVRLMSSRLSLGLSSLLG